MDLPKEFKGLGQAYKGAIQRIDDQLEGFRFLAKQVLGWLTYAERLMSITELQHAIAIELGEREFDKDNLVDPSELVSVCAGLVVVDDQSNVVRLVHYTTQEYFEQHGESLLPEARHKIAESCLTYLMYDDLAIGWLHGNNDHSNSSDDGSDGAGTSSIRRGLHSRIRISVLDMIEKYPFSKYAAQHWARHTGYGVHDRVKCLLLDFAKDDNKISTAAQVLLRLERDYPHEIFQFDWDKSRSPKPVSAMHLLAYLGADELISILLEQGFKADAKDLNNATPMYWAIHKGNLEVVKLLIARKDVDINACNRQGKAPLSHAAEMGHSAIVELLLTRKDVKADAKDLKHETPLLHAVYYKRKDIMRQLLRRDDVDINTVNKYGYTALHRASIFRDADVAAILLAHANIDMDHVDQKERTPLIWAATFGRLAIVELLLSHGGVNVNIEDCRGRTALLEAAIRGHKDVVKLLLAHAMIDLDIEDDKGRNILTQVEDWQKDLAEYGEGQQATLNLLRAALEERSPRK